MKFLFAAKQEKNVEAYLEAPQGLIARGDDVAVLRQERDAGYGYNERFVQAR